MPSNVSALVFGGAPWLLVVLLLVRGMAVIADTVELSSRMSIAAPQGLTPPRS